VQHAVGVVVRGRVRADLVHDLARLLRAGRIDGRALPPGECAQRAGREVGTEWQQHAGGPDRVPAEQRQEPRCAGGEESVARCERVGGGERVEVGEAAGDERAQPIITAAHLHLGAMERGLGGQHHRLPGSRRRDRQRDPVSPAGSQRHRPPQYATVDRGRRGSGAEPHAGAVVAGPDQAAVLERRQQRRHRRPGLDVGHPGEVAGHPDLEYRAQRRARSRDDGDRLDGVARRESTRALEGDGRVGAGVAELTQHTHEPDVIGVDDGRTHRLGLDPVHRNGQHREQPPVGAEDAVGPVPDLAVGPGQRHGRGPYRRHELLQVGLAEPLPGGRRGRADVVEFGKHGA